MLEDHDIPPQKRKLSELKKQRRAEQEERKREYWRKRKELENTLGLEGYEQYECREIIRFMLETEPDIYSVHHPITDSELDDLIDLYFPPNSEKL